MERKIKQGDILMCIEDVVMNHGTGKVAFTKGYSYKSNYNGTLMNNQGEIHHITNFDFMNQYFKFIDDNKIPALLLAGRLALAARAVTSARVKDLSSRIEELEIALNAYDNEILSL